jgi:putative hydrolase of the HAD superfamily
VVAEGRPKFFIWDFDGTLAWRPGSWTGALVAVLRRYAPGLNVTAELVRPYLQSGFPWHAPENPHPGLSPSEWWDDLLPVFSRAVRAAGVQNGQAAAIAREVRTVYLDPATWQRYSDTLPALEMLSARGWKHILLTNHVPELPLLLDQLGLRGYFQAIFNSAETGYEKPNPRAFRAVMDWTGPDTSALVIGDNFGTDILGGLESGLPGILVRKPHPDAPIFCATLTEISEKV